MQGLRISLIWKIILPLLIGIIITTILTIEGISNIYPLALAESSLNFNFKE